MTKINNSWYRKPSTKIPTRLAAGGIVVRKGGDQILIALIIEGRFTEFSLPKGGVKVGETLEEAARREIHEEAGIAQLHMASYIGKRERLNITKRRWITVHYFLFTTQQKTGMPTDQKEKHVVKWFPIDSLPNMLWPEQRKLIEDNSSAIKALFVTK